MARKGYSRASEIVPLCGGECMCHELYGSRKQNLNEAHFSVVKHYALLTARRNIACRMGKRVHHFLLLHSI